MALTKGYNVTYRWQGLSLHCWLTSLEMLMDWRYQNIYGVDPATQAPRAQHTAQVVQAKARQAPDQVPHIFGVWFKAGYRPAKVNDYGLDRTKQNLKPTVTSWEKQLQDCGPILLSGNYGPAKIVGSHCVLAVGISGSNQIVYLDPFLIGVQAIHGNHYTYISPRMLWPGFRWFPIHNRRIGQLMEQEIPVSVGSQAASLDRRGAQAVRATWPLTTCTRAWAPQRTVQSERRSRRAPARSRRRRHRAGAGRGSR